MALYDVESYKGKYCVYIDRVTKKKKYDGKPLGMCLYEQLHSIDGKPIVWFEKPFLGFTWQYKSDVAVVK